MVTYPKTHGLLISMALRSRHDFGLLDRAQQLEAIDDASKTYDELLKHEVIAYVTFKHEYFQLYEEASGAGFYAPDLESYYLSFLN